MVIGFDTKTKDTDNELEATLANLRYMCTDDSGFSEEKYEYYKDLYMNHNKDIDTPRETPGFVEPVKKSISYELPLPLYLVPMNSSWPMKCHDLHHTSQSPYSTAGSPDCEEKWRFVTAGGVDGSPVIGDDGVIYFGEMGRNFYAVYPNGTLKWDYYMAGWIWSAPAIDEDGTVYVGSWDCYLYAFNPDGSLKWRFDAGDIVTTSPAIGDDGTIYFGTMDHPGRIFAVNPDGSEKWHYDTGDFINSEPAIADDSTIYIGSADGYLYAMNPNGTLKWRFETGDWVKSHPSIADDGTIYVGSFDGNTYAINPDGSEKWRFGNPGSGANSASIASDGTIYVAGTDMYALNPDGSLKWTFDFGSSRYVGHSSPAISSDGTIYVGVYHGQGVGGEIVVVNPDGTEKWRKYIANEWVDSSPCIAEDGTVYIGSGSIRLKDGYYYPMGYLHAFGPIDSNNPPGTPSINGPLEGQVGEEQEYAFCSFDSDNNPVSFFIDWGEGNDPSWSGDYASGEDVRITHTWEEEGTYIIGVKARDTLGEESDWAYLEVTMPVNQPVQYPLLELFRERFPLLYQLFIRVLEVNLFDT